MKQRKILEKFESATAKRFDDLENFLYGPMVNAHEYLPTDPEFREKVTKLYQLVYELKTATDQLHSSMRKV